MDDIKIWQANFVTYINELNLLRDDYRAIMEYIDEVPVIRPRGRWTRKHNVHGVAYCSKCDYELHTNNTNFCPNCGADMREEEQDG